MNVKTKAACELSADYHLYVLLSPHSYCQKDQDYPKRPNLLFFKTVRTHVNAHEILVTRNREKPTEREFRHIRRRPSENPPHLTSPTARLTTAENSRSESSTETSPPLFSYHRVPGKAARGTTTLKHCRCPKNRAHRHLHNIYLAPAAESWILGFPPQYPPHNSSFLDS